ncbi:MAG: hypothetical protein ACKOSQ_02980, partial [Planctomycetaceae bacterium]
MSRRRAPAGATISLFPFLAVLLCTMGALLVLLVIFSRRARDSEAAAARAGAAARDEELELARDELRWRLEQLRAMRERTAADLGRERMRLAGVEEDARKLADEIDTLERTALALEQRAPTDDAAASVVDAERRLAAARAALDAVRADGAKKPPAYAVVPYEEAGGTHRRPLYVECCVDGVFLQPENIRLGPADFEGPPGPGNPLASALRAAREQIARGPRESGDPAVQPYPLLLVRPSGVMAYYAAREALVSWGSEFGYQFVDEDWQLQYPPADPALAAVEQRAIEESRRRIEWLAQVRPARPAKPTQQYRAATTRGGVVAEGGPSVLGDQSRFDWTEEQAGAAARRGGAGNGGGTGATEGPGGGDVVLGGGNAAGRGGPSGGFGQAGTGAGNTDGDRYAGPSRFYSGQPPTADAESDSGKPGGTGGPHASGSAAGRADATAHEPATRDLAADAGPNGGSAAAAGAGSPTAGGSAATGTRGSSGSAASPGSSASSGAAGGATGSGGGPALPGLAQSAGASGAAGSAAGSLAGTRGSNWASLATAERPVPLTRPIRIECAAHEFRLYDDASARVETRIPIGTRTADSVDPLVQAVHARVGRWGLAGERMYWRPELVLSETDDGGSRRADLERLLADSGLDTRRGKADTEV